MRARGEIVSLQVVRAGAATAVVYAHAARAASVHRPANIILPPGAFEFDTRWADLGVFGVDLFFVLSGFLMLYISRSFFDGRRTAGGFLVDRLVRIWPMYVIATALTLVWEVQKDHPVISRALDFQWHRLLGFFFVPSFNKDGNVAPILGVGWTLTYEFFFYLCFTFVILARPRWPVLALGSLLAAAYLAGLAAPITALGAFLHNDLLFEFLAGSMIAHAIQRGWYPRHGWAWIAIGLVLLFASTLVNVSSLPRLLVYGVPASIIFCGALALDRVTQPPRWMVRLGDASYSLYLFHIFIAGAVVNRILALVIRTPLANFAVPIATLVAVAVCIVVGVAIFSQVEKRVLKSSNRFVNGLLGHRDPPPMVIQSDR